MAVQTSLLPEEKIFEANAVARAEWRTSSVFVQRIAAILISNIEADDKDFSPMTIPIHRIIGSKGGNSYTLARNIMDDLLNQNVIIPVPCTKRDLIGFHIFKSKIRYYAQKNAVKVCLNPELKPYYLELKKNFVAYGLTEFLSLPGTYHQSMYKLLKSWESEPSCVIDLPELHRILGTTPSLKKTYSNLDARVLAPAHKFINERTSLKYDYEPQKFGRKVVSVVFTFKSKPKIKKAPPQAKKQTHRGGENRKTL